MLQLHNSVETIWSKTYLDLNNIEQAMVFKENVESLHNSRSATLITRKKKVAFVSLADLYSKLNINDSVPVKFMVDGQLQEDTSNIRFEPSVIKNIEVIRNKSDKIEHGFVGSNYISITTQYQQYPGIHGRN
jgi:hypothetical protein